MLLNAMEIHLEPAFKNRTACRRQMPIKTLNMKSNYTENALNFTVAQCSIVDQLLSARVLSYHFFPILGYYDKEKKIGDSSWS